MDTGIFKREAIQKTLALIDELPENWKTFNDKLHTYIITDKVLMKSGVHLKDEEQPILECVLEDSFMLITTTRVISRISNEYFEMPLKEIMGFSNEYVEENFKKIEGKPPKTNLAVVKGDNNKKLVYKIDSYHPAYFAQTLIINLSNYVRCGNWFWNPKLR